MLRALQVATVEEPTCAAEHCHTHLRRGAGARVAHALRRLHEREVADAPRLSPTELVGTDLLSPRSHTVPECRHDATHGRDPTKGPSDEECFARSLVHHISQKHEIDPNQVHEAVGKFGFPWPRCCTARVR